VIGASGDAPFTVFAPTDAAVAWSVLRNEKAFDASRYEPVAI
jgi:hypothetical protein